MTEVVESPESTAPVPTGPESSASGGTAAGVEVDGRTRHYGVFYGLEPLGSSPYGLVHGNCQAESVRIVLDGPDLATVRIPPVHELVAADLPHLERVLSRASVLVSQPISEDYRELPLGTAQVRSLLPSAARMVMIPVVRFAGLYPAQVTVRPPSDPGLNPPVVNYHNLFTLAEAAGLTDAEAESRLTPAQVLTIAQASTDELRRREAAHGTIVVSDLLAAPTFAQMRTMNHPGNAILLPLAARLREQLGLTPEATDPGRPLLSGVQAPRHPAVVQAFGLDVDPTTDWLVGGEAIPAAEVRTRQLAWYAERPDVVTAGLERYTRSLAVLGLS